MPAWLAILSQTSRKTHAFLKRNWKAALQIRERIRFREEAWHLLLAGLVGVIGGSTNLAFAFCSDLVEFQPESRLTRAETEELMAGFGPGRALPAGRR